MESVKELARATETDEEALEWLIRFLASQGFSSDRMARKNGLLGALRP